VPSEGGPAPIPLDHSRADHAMRSEAAPIIMSNYSLGLRCEAFGAPRSDSSRRWCSECRGSNSPGVINSVEAATSPWWTEPDGVLARVRGDAAVVREIISLRGL